MRKTSDMALLLGSRGRGRSRSGVAKFVRGVWDSWFGRSQWRNERPTRSLQVPGWLAAAALLAAFAGGFLLGGKVGTKPGADGAGLHASQPKAPGFVGEFDARPLSRTAFLVAMYPGVAENDAKVAAKALCDWLASQGVQRARPYLAAGKDGGDIWTVAVYYMNETEQTATRNLLVQLPEAVPDASFVDLRKIEAQWPREWTIR